jgi:Tfp pilus assembly protein PilF
LVPAAAVAAVLLATLAALQNYVIDPARGRQMAETAMENLVTLRQETGRVPLRYIPEFRRARVTRSAFDTVHPGEASVEEQLRQATDLAPNALETRLALGLFLLDKGALDEAESNLEKALAIEPGSILAANGLAVVHYERAIRNSPRARDLLRKGIALLRDAKRKSPGDLQVAFNLAMLYQESGSKQVAKKHWTTYLEMDPDSEWGDVAAEKLGDLGGPDEPGNR